MRSKLQPAMVSDWSVNALKPPAHNVCSWKVNALQAPSLNVSDWRVDVLQAPARYVFSWSADAFQAPAFFSLSFFLECHRGRINVKLTGCHAASNTTRSAPPRHKKAKLLNQQEHPRSQTDLLWLWKTPSKFNLYYIHGCVLKQ